MNHKNQDDLPTLPPAVQEAINAHAKYYAEHHKLGMSIRADMTYIAKVAMRWKPDDPAASARPSLAAHPQRAAIIDLANEVDEIGEALISTNKNRGMQLVSLGKRISMLADAAPPSPQAAQEAPPSFPHWICGCGHTNGCNLARCAMCDRDPRGRDRSEA